MRFCRQPPTGYDSIIGEPGGDLNYDEAVGESSLHLVYVVPRSHGMQCIRLDCSLVAFSFSHPANLAMNRTTPFDHCS